MTITDRRPDATTDPHGPQGTALGAGLAAAGMCCVGSLVAVSGTIVDAPVFTLQAFRYAVATVLLAAVVRISGRRIPRPRGTEWLWLGAVAASGLVLFNVGVVRASAHAEPAVIGVAVAAVPVLLALVPCLATRSRPAPGLLVGAAVVTIGAVLVEGAGRTDAAGVGWALLVLACEAGFTLFAVPVLGRLGAYGVSLHSVWMATLALAVIGVASDGPAAALHLRPQDLVAALYLAIVVTVLAFLMWYTAVGRLGAGVAGLFTGVVPVSASVIGVALGSAMPGPLVWLGSAVVAAGVALGLGLPGRRTRREASSASAAPQRREYVASETPV